MKSVKSALLGLAMLGVAATAHAQNEQFIPMIGYWVGPYAPGGSGIFGGFIDYVNMINARDGGVNGVKLTCEKCETEYNNARGVECYERLKKKGPTGATMVHPLSTGITYSLIDKAHGGQDPDRLARLRPHRRRPTAACFRTSSRWSRTTGRRTPPRSSSSARRKAGWTSSRARRS